MENSLANFVEYITKGCSSFSVTIQGQVKADKLKSEENMPEQEQSDYADKLEQVIEENKFSIQDSLWDSEAEKKINNILKSFISTEYIIIPHVGLREIFNWKWKDKSIPKSIAKMHFDFVLYNADYQPVMIIEIWGKDHENDPLVKIHDDFKNKLLNKLKMSLVVIELQEFVPDEQLKELVVSKIKTARPNAYCPKCKAIMEIRNNKKTHECFYGCTKYHEDGKGTRNIDDVPSLYRDEVEI